MPRSDDRPPAPRRAPRRPPAAARPDRPPRPGERSRSSRAARRRAARRRRIAVLAGIAVVLAALGTGVAVLMAGGGSPGPGRAQVTQPAASHVRTHVSSTTTRATHTRTAPVRLRTPLAVGRVTLHLVGPAPAADPAEGPRPLPTVVRYPVLGRGERIPAGGFPLVVFSQGFDEPAEAYRALLQDWAAAGFVVADPTYPRTDPDSADGVDESDIVNHPGDLRYVIGALLRASRAPHGALHGVVNPSKVAVAGQSDGGDVSLAVAADTCCRDPRVRAAVILSGAELASFGGSYFGAGSAPLLVVQGSADTINAPACSAQIYAAAPRPKYYLDIVGADHLTPYLDPGPIRKGVAHVVTAFLEATLNRRPATFHRQLARRTLGAGLRLSAGARAPVPVGSCPGAP